MLTEARINRAAERHIRVRDFVLDRSAHHATLEAHLNDSTLPEFRQFTAAMHLLGSLTYSLAAGIVRYPLAFKDNKTLELGRMTDLRLDESVTDFAVRRVHDIDMNLTAGQQGE